MEMKELRAKVMESTRDASSACASARMLSTLIRHLSWQTLKLLSKLETAGTWQRNRNNPKLRNQLQNYQRFAETSAFLFQILITF